MVKPLLIQIVEDLNDIHDAVELDIKSVDDKVTKAVSAVQAGKMALMDLEPVRAELWSAYVEQLISKIDGLLRDLSLALVSVRAHKMKINKCRRDFKKIKDKTEFQKSKSVDELRTLFDSLIALWNELLDSEDDLRSEAWKNFLRGLYLPFATITSSGYWYLVTQTKLLNLSLEASLIWFVIVLFVLYFALKYLVLHPPNNKKKVDE